MLRRYLTIIGCSCAVIWAAPSWADQLKLRDGRTITGHILHENTGTGMLVIGLVEEGRRTGIQEIFYRHEIRDVIRDGQFADAPMKEIKVCYEYGYQWGRCIMAAYFGYRCESSKQYLVPQQCSDTPKMKQGVRDGVKSVYDDFPNIPGRKTAVPEAK